MVKIFTNCEIRIKLSSECESNLDSEKQPGSNFLPDLKVRQHLKEEIEDSNLENIAENTWLHFIFYLVRKP